MEGRAHRGRWLLFTSARRHMSPAWCVSTTAAGVLSGVSLLYMMLVTTTQAAAKDQASPASSTSEHAVVTLLAEKRLLGSDVLLDILPGQAGGSVVRVGRPKSPFFFYDGTKDGIVRARRAATHWFGRVTLGAKQEIETVSLPKHDGTVTPDDAALAGAIRRACAEWFTAADRTGLYSIGAWRGHDARVADSAYGVSIDAIDLRGAYHEVIFLSKELRVIGGVSGTDPRKIHPSGQLR